MNPTDMRGYRYIVVLYEEGKMMATLNREYTLRELSALHVVLTLVSHVGEKRGLIAQTVVAGNNSQTFERKTNRILLGNSKEPSILHGHGWWRGVIGVEYFPHAPLLGPSIGVEFHMKGDSKEQQKVSWTADALKSLTISLRYLLEETAKTFAKGRDLCVFTVWPKISS